MSNLTNSFNHCFLPRTDLTLRDSVSTRPIPSLTDYRSVPTYPLISHLIHTLILKELRFFRGDQRKLLTSLMRRDDFTIEAAFNSLCSFTQGEEGDG